LETKTSVKSYVQKKTNGWQPEWSSDEKILARNLNMEVQVYETNAMESLTKRMTDLKVANFSVSPSHAPYYFLCYIQGTKGQPSFAKLFRYPNLNPAEVIANKSFFQGDHVEMKWNKAGTSVLLLTSTDVDSSGASYYGKQTLHYLDTKGNSAMVQLAKEGPIYSVEWNPKGNEFCVVYGFMPAKATLFDLKCEPKFDFGTGPRNTVYYNPFGNLLLLAGFGNLRGKVEVWDVKATKMLCNMDAADTTYLQWCPDGQHFLTCTTAPRLRVGNGVKVWHYSGSLLHEHPVAAPHELWESTWQSLPDSSFAEFAISLKKVSGIQPSQPQVSKEIYRPPGARSTNFAPILKMLDQREAPSKPAGAPKPEAGKNAAKNKKKREQRKLKKEEGEEGESEAPARPVKFDVVVTSDVTIKLTGDAEIDKQLKDLKKKLDQIARLKAEQAAGRTLELNQKEKLAKEEEFRKQLDKLSLGK